MTNKILTICIPVYNSSDVCERAINSALLQDTNEEYRVLIVDDNSNQATKEVLKQYQNDPKVKIIHNSENLGLVGNWNKCLVSVETEFLTYLHHDDEFRTEFVSEFYRLQKKFQDTDIFVLNGSRSKFECETEISASDYKPYIYEMHAVPAPTGVVFRRPSDIGFDEQFNYCPETDLYLTMLEKLEYSTVYSCNNLCIRHDWSKRVTNSTVGDESQYRDQLKIGAKHKNSKNITPENRYQLIKNFKRKVALASRSEGSKKMFRIYRHQLREANALDLPYFKTIPLRYFSPKLQLLNMLSKTNISKFIRRTKIASNIWANKKLEPHANIRNLTAYILRGGYYPELGVKDFTNTFSIVELEDHNVVEWQDKKIYYPKEWTKEKVSKNFNAVLNEQRPKSPHKYPENSEIRPGSVVYDLGAAEGLQSLIWLDVASKVYVFEPEPLFYDSLLMTFKEAIEQGKAIVIPRGIAEQKEDLEMYGTTLKLDRLENIIEEFGLEKPSLVKADIEGEERSLLAQLIDIEKNAELVICNYHKPDDEIVLKDLINKINPEYKISYTPGVVFFNRDAFIVPQDGKIIHPVVRKSLVRASLN